MVFSNTLLAGSAAQGGSVYKIDQSIRFNDNDSPKLQRTFGSCLLYTSPSPRDGLLSRMPSSA